MNDEAAKGRAALPSRSDGRKDDRTKSHFEISRRRHDHGVISAELEDAATETIGQILANGMAHPRGTRGGNDGHIL